jgi:hypothetical protein
VGGFVFGAGLALVIIRLHGDPFQEKYGGRSKLAPPLHEAVPVPTSASLHALAPVTASTRPPAGDDPFAGASPVKVAVKKRGAFPKRPT